MTELRVEIPYSSASSRPLVDIFNYFIIFFFCIFKIISTVFKSYDKKRLDILVRNYSSVVNRNKTKDYQAKISIRFGFISFRLLDNPLIQPVPHFGHCFMTDPTQLSKQFNKLAYSAILDGFSTSFFSNKLTQKLLQYFSLTIIEAVKTFFREKLRYILTHWICKINWY